uniref:LCCL domain-containing protein n=1 Tax=Gongylonema pulchrum TaxID=637853 RepID=A0A183CVX0_9BILA
LQILFSAARSVSVCRSECVERNKYAIVRVHLSENWARVGICQNMTDPVENGLRSRVFPFICDRSIGEWHFDDNDSEGIAEFKVTCPKVVKVPARMMYTCPGSFTSTEVP